MSRRRKKHDVPHENHERWLVSYADFITLLFAFFVVMYSISSINEGKYRVLSDSLVSAFDESSRSLEPIQMGTPIQDPIIQHNAITETLARIGVDHTVVPQAAPQAQGNAVIDNVAETLEKDMQSLIDQDLVKITKDKGWVEIEINSSILFASGDANLVTDARPVLAKIADILKGLNNQIRVEGFTDNVPISTAAFPSNWELSGARAASVVRLFAEAGLNQGRMSATGFGEYRPVASNASEAGRQKNRRVSIVVLADNMERRSTDLDPALRSDAAQTNDVQPVNAGVADAAPNSPANPIKLGVNVPAIAPITGGQ